MTLPGEEIDREQVRRRKVRPEWVITTCGGKKLDGPAPARRLYCGTFAQKQMQAANVIGPTKGHLILSNVYGYMHPSTVITRYDSHWGYPDTMSDEELLVQVAGHGIVAGDRVLHLGAREYATQSERLLPRGVMINWLPLPLPDTRIGYQGHQLSQVIKHRSLPPGWETATSIRD